MTDRPPASVIVMSDYAYAWNDDGCAILLEALGSDPGLAQLDEEMARWAEPLGPNCYPGNLKEWEEYHEIGLAFARRLKAIVGPACRVRYEKVYYNLDLPRVMIEVESG